MSDLLHALWVILGAIGAGAILLVVLLALLERRPARGRHSR